MQPLISVVVPARDEAAHLPRLLARLASMPEIGEFVVADGGSRDETLAVARICGARVVEGARGRGPQQNLGASHTSGEILWFLHADCLPAHSCGAQILRAHQQGAIGGHFRVRFEAHGLAPRVFERVARAQARWGIFYGDSGLWTTRRNFEALGGFQNWPLFEDYEFARRMRNWGRVETLPGRIRVSSRRFQNRPWHTLALWIELQIRFSLGASPHELAKRYRR